MFIIIKTTILKNFVRNENGHDWRASAVYPNYK